MQGVSVLDVLSITTSRDAAVVMDTHEKAIAWWPVLIDAFKRHHGPEYVTVTKTAIVSKRTHRILRLWIPYAPDPTQPLDWTRHRRGYVMLNLYDRCFTGRLP